MSFTSGSGTPFIFGIAGKLGTGKAFAATMLADIFENEYGCRTHTVAFADQLKINLAVKKTSLLHVLRDLTRLMRTAACCRLKGRRKGVTSMGPMCG